jgi:hypothetical protein
MSWAHQALKVAVDASYHFFPASPTSSICLSPASRAASLFLLPPPVHQWLSYTQEMVVDVKGKSLNMLSLKDSKEAESTPPTPTPR